VLITLTNSWNEVNIDVTYHDFSAGTKLCNIFNKSECVTVDSSKKIPINLKNHDSKVWVPQGNSAETIEVSQ